MATNEASASAKMVDEMGATSRPNPQRNQQVDESNEIEFIAPPPKELECPLCLQILKRPTLTICGHHFCRTCIDRVIAMDHVCPLCKEKGFQTFPDKATERKILALRVRCRMKLRGCQWEGELGDLERHLDVRKGDCGFVEVECEFGCTAKMLRGDISQHMEGNTHKHLILLALPQGGSESERRLQEKRAELLQQQLLRREEKMVVKMKDELQAKDREIEGQLRKRDELTKRELAKMKDELQAKDREIEGQLQKRDELTKRELVKMKDELQAKDREIEGQLRKRDELTKRELVKMKQELSTQTKELRAQLQQKDEEICSLRESVRHLENRGVFPFEFIMPNFTQHKATNTEWFSPPFYSHSDGYKQCMAVYANGHGQWKDNHTTFYLYTMRGEHDDQLKWPRQLDTYVEVLNKSGKWEPNPGGGCSYGRRPKPIADREKHNCPHRLVKHSTLEQYLKDDCLHIRITELAPR